MGRARRVGARRARGPGAARRRRDGGRLTHRRAALAAACSLLATAACTGLTSGSNVPVAIEFVQPPDTVHVADTVPIHVRVFNRAGDSIVGAPILLSVTNDSLLGIDTARTAVIGKAPGRDSLIARSGGLLTAPFPITILQP